MFDTNLPTSLTLKSWSQQLHTGIEVDIEANKKQLVELLSAPHDINDDYRVLDCSIDHGVSDIDFGFLLFPDVPIKIFRYFMKKLFYKGYLDEWCKTGNPRIKGVIKLLQSYQMEFNLLCDQGNLDDWSAFQEALELVERCTAFSLLNGSVQKDIAEDIMKLSLQKVVIGDGDSMIRARAFSKNNIVMLLQVFGLRVPYYLLYLISLSDSPERDIQDWKEIKDSFKNGGFDSENKLHRALEYINFREVLTHPSVAPYIKIGTLESSGYKAYSQIFEQQDESHGLDNTLAQAEIDALAYEATLLKQFVMKLKEKADSLGRRLVVVPNYSYGYLPVSPIVDELETQGIEIWYGEKVGSSGHHGNTNVFGEEVFIEHEKSIIEDQPIIVVVDGSSRLEANSLQKTEKGMYPDSYKGFLNHVMALNDALGYPDTDEYVEKFGKDEDDIGYMKEGLKYQKCRERYKNARGEDSQVKRYNFEFYQTSDNSCIIKAKKQREIDIIPCDIENIDGPTLIFCNVGVLHAELPVTIQNTFAQDDNGHVTGFFDDTGHIIHLAFQYNQTGVVYHNDLEERVRQAYMSMNSVEGYTRRNSSLVRRIISG